MKSTVRMLLIIFSIIFFFQGKQALAWELLPMRTACLEQTLCSRPGNTVGCTNEDDQPLIKVHNTLLTIRQPLSSNAAFIQECITFRSGVQRCIVLPVRNVGSTWELPNYVRDGANTSSSADWGTDAEWFENGIRQYCLAGVSDNTDPDAIAYCDSLVTARMTELNGELNNQGYQFHGLYNPAPAQMRSSTGPYVSYPVDGALNRSYIYSSRTNDDLVHSFRIVTFSDPVRDPSAGDPSDKIARLAFEDDAPVCPNAPSYDPFGQVFNATTLEPVEAVRVALYVKDVRLPTPPDTTNPTLDQYILAKREVFPDPTIIDSFYTEIFTTSYLGSFVFRVPPGNYKLLALRDGVTAPTVLPDPISVVAFTNLGTVMDTSATLFGDTVQIRVSGHPQTLYPKVYQVGESTTNLGNIDIPNILETTTAERRDISVTAASAGPRIVSFYQTTNNTRKIVVKGNTNIPYGVVSAKSATTGHVLSQDTADIRGEFTLYVRPQDLSSPDDLLLVPEPANYVRVEASLTNPLALVKTVISKVSAMLTHVVYAQTTNNAVKVGPILNHVQGYAKDASGNVLPGAKVYVMDSVVGGMKSQTIADEKGFFSFSTEELPHGEFYLEYQPEGSTKMFKVEVSQFIAQNADYIAKENVNLAQVEYSEEAQVYLTQNPLPTETREQESSINPKPGTSGSPNDAVAPTRAVEPGPVNQPVSSALLMYVAILLLLIVGAGLLIMYYMKRKQEPHLYE